MNVFHLPSNRPPDRFYRGGAKIAELRGEPDLGTHTPEDWIASTTSVHGHGGEGLSRLPGGQLLTDAVAADPELWLGAEHLTRFGVDTKLLVKLLDAGQRLPVHAHPDAAFAAEHLGHSHGKAEAWFVLSPGVVHLALRSTLSRARLAEMVTAQRTEELLALMHVQPVRTGDTVFVPPGMLHAVGSGILLAEVQEPEDLSILLEWTGFDLDGASDGHLGLGFDVALTAVEVTGRSPDEVGQLVRTGVRNGSVLSVAADPFFRLDLADAARAAHYPPGFAVLIALDGPIALRTGTGEVVRLSAGSTVVVRHAAGGFDLAGSGTVLVARPPVRPG